MSAFIVGDNHIQYLVYCYFRLKSGRGTVGFEKANEIGQELTNENYKSVNHRYKEITAPELFSYKYKEYKYDLDQVIASIVCYKYQSCEHPEWIYSKAKKIVDEMISRCLSDISSGKIWGAPEPVCS